MRLIRWLFSWRVIVYRARADRFQRWIDMPKATDFEVVDDF